MTGGHIRLLKCWVNPSYFYGNYMIEIDEERFDKIIVWLEMLRAKLQQDGLSSYESTVDDIICELEISEVGKNVDVGGCVRWSKWE